MPALARIAFTCLLSADKLSSQSSVGVSNESVFSQSTLAAIVQGKKPLGFGKFRLKPIYFSVFGLQTNCRPLVKCRKANKHFMIAMQSNSINSNGSTEIMCNSTAIFDGK